MPKPPVSAPFEIGGQTVAPGTQLQFDLPGAQLFTHTPIGMTVEVIHGRRPGPTLLVCAAIHGNELNGVEVIRRLRTQKSLRQLSGTLVLVPVVNLHGFIFQSRYLPDRRDLNRCFPGSETGSLGSRVAHQFFHSVVRRCTHIIDLHTAAVHRDNLPQIRADLSDANVRAMAEGFSIPVVVNAGLIDNSLRAEAGRIGIPVITYEAGEALRLSEQAIVTGVRGVMNTMRALGMLKTRAKASKAANAEPYIATTSKWFRATNDGMFRPFVELGTRVKPEQPLGAVTSPFSSDEEMIVGTVDGIVIGLNNLPLVNEGDALFHVASFGQAKLVGDQIAAHGTAIETDPLFAMESTDGNTTETPPDQDLS